MLRIFLQLWNLIHELENGHQEHPEIILNELRAPNLYREQVERCTILCVNESPSESDRNFFNKFLVGDSGVKVLVFVEDLGLLGHEVKNAE